MKALRIAMVATLLLFVGATVGLIIAQEVTFSEPEVKPADAAPNGPSEAADEATPVGPEETAVRETDGPEAPAPQGAEEAAGVPAETSQGAGSEGQEAGETGIAGSLCVVDAIYFHNTLRCVTCRRIEATAQSVIERAFQAEIGAGQLRWSTVNMEEQRQFVDRYSLVKPTLVLVRDVGDGDEAWTALDDTWQLIGSPNRFESYVIERVHEFLGGCP